MRVSALMTPPLTRRAVAASPKPGTESLAPVDTADVKTASAPLLTGKTLARVARWGAIGALAGAVPFIAGAKVGSLATMLAAENLVEAVAEGRQGLGQQLLALAGGAALAVAVGIGGTYLGGINDGFALNQCLLGAGVLGAYSAGVSLAGETVRWARGNKVD